ncbi:MAG TPA: tripartite transporter [Parvularcula sp.]|nr:tripartite transporter [Parvularcula sp.]HBS31265.1 tripartite transporter [Parvularcula sp.]HBS34931.1 tripartite transporter [Parvularcula sp.]
MILSLCILILAGYPVAFSLAGTALLFAFLGLSFGVFDIGYLKPLPQRIFGAVNNQTLIAIPMFVLMGVILEKAKIAEDLLDSMARLFGSWRGGLGLSVTMVGALLAASTGIVGATVVTMGLLSLPTMLKRGYDPAFAAGSIAAAGTLGQIIPPSIVLILLGDVISNAYQKAQLEAGVFAPKAISVGDLFAGALLPGIMLVGLYLGYQAMVALFDGKRAPAIPAAELGTRKEVWRAALRALPAPLLLIIAVLGSILAGVATPTEAASVGAVGALLIAGARFAPPMGFLAGRGAVLAAALAIVALLIITAFVDLRLGREASSVGEKLGMLVAIALCALIPWGAAVSGAELMKRKALRPIADQTARVTTMVFTILIGAAMFSLVFRGLGGDDAVHRALDALPGGVVGAMIGVMAIMFILGFFLDFIEITLVVVPLVAPALLKMGVDPIWLGVMMAVNLQTSFLTPPFGFALFYLRGVAPPAVRTLDIYRGALPFIAIQLFALVLLAMFPNLATWLPGALYD